MGKRIFFGIMLTLLLIGMLTLAFDVQRVNAWEGGLIYIRADGSIDPSTAPIQRIGNVYTLTDNISINCSTCFGIIVERDNIVLDGAGYSLVDSRQGYITGGIYLYERSNVTIRNTTITGFLFEGVVLEYCSNIIVYKNNVGVKGVHGILVKWSSNTVIFENNLSRNGYGVRLFESSNSLVYHNSFIDNDYQADDYESDGNAWDNGCEGNYWNDYNGTDSDGDGIGDTPYKIGAARIVKTIIR